MASAGSIFVDLNLKDQNYVAGLNRARQGTRGFAGQAQGDLAKTRQAFTSVLNPVSNLSGAIRTLGITIASALSVQKLVQYSDTFKQLESRLSIVVSGSGELRDVQQELFDIAQRTRQPLEGVFNLYTRLAQAIPEAQRSQFDLLGVTENINKALAITGEGSAQASSAILQFTQAAASGFQASGQEINALLDSAPRLAQALQRSFGDGSKSLKKLAEDGDLSTESVLRALSSLSGQALILGEEFDKTQLTVGQAFTKLENSFLNFIGNNEDAQGATTRLASDIEKLAGFFDTLDKKINDAGFALEKYFSKGGSYSVITPEQFASALPPQYTEYSDGDIQAGIDTARQMEEQRARDAAREAEKIAKEREKQALRDIKKEANDLSNSYERNRKYILGLNDATLAYNDTIAELDTLLGAGRISQDQYSDALVRVQEEYDKSQEKAKVWSFNIEDAAEQASKNIQSTFADFLFDPFEDGLDGMLKGFADTLRRMAAEAASAQILASIFGEAGFSFGSAAQSAPSKSIFSSLFDGLFADGGYIQPGHFGIAGEAGAELVYGGMSGATVIPQGGGGVSINIINNNNSSVTQSSQKTANGTDITVMIDAAVAANIGTPGSKTNQALGAFSNRSLVRR